MRQVKKKKERKFRIQRTAISNDHDSLYFI